LLRTLLLVFLGVLILGSFFFSGLYWEGQRLLFQLVLTVPLLAGLLLPGKVIGASSVRRGDFFVAAVVLLYAIGIVRPASTYGALMSALLWLSYFAVYLLFQRLALAEREKRAVVLAFAAFCTLVALLGLAVYTQTIYLQEGLVGGRLSVLLRYPNATAALLVAGAAAVLALLPQLFKHSQRTMAFLSLLAVLPALYLTHSRGGWLTLAAIVLFICLWQRALWVLLHYLTGATIGSLAIVAMLQTSAEPATYLVILALAVPYAWGYTLIPLGTKGVKYAFATVLLTALAITAYLGWSPLRYTIATNSLTPHAVLSFTVGELLPETEHTITGRVEITGTDAAPPAYIIIWGMRAGRVESRLARQQLSSGEDFALSFVTPTEIKDIRVDFSVNAVATTMQLKSPRLVGGGLASWLSSPLHRLLPLPLANRLAQMGHRVLLGDARLTFVRDGLRIAHQSLWLGQGGRTWEALYRSVQSYDYGSRHAHSEPLEMLLDIGLVGLLLFVLFLVGVFRRITRGNGVDGILAVVAMALLINSVGEFIGAFPSFYFVLFAFLGLLSSSPNPPQRTVNRWGTGLPLVLCIALVVSLPYLTITLVAENAFDRMQREMGVGDHPAALATVASAHRLAPFVPNLRIALAQLSWLDLVADRQMRLSLAEGRRLEPGNAQFATLLGQLAMRHGEFTQAVAYFGQALKLEVMRVRRYEDLASAQVRAALQLAERDLAQGLEFAHAAVATGELFYATAAVVPPPYAMRATPALHLALGQAHLIVRKYKEAETHLRQAIRAPDEVTRRVATVTLGRLYELQGDAVQARLHLAGKLGRTDLELYYSQLSLIAP